jgi:hypothetical protein
MVVVMVVVVVVVVGHEPLKYQCRHESILRDVLQAHVHCDQLLVVLLLLL